MPFKCKWFLLLALLVFIAGCASTTSVQRGSSGDVEIIAPSNAAMPKPLFCDMRIQIKLTDPIAPYLSNFGTVTVYGKEGFRISKTFPVKFGTQMVTIAELEAGRYDVEVTYADYIVTKCVILGCVCVDNWREVFLAELASDMQSQSGLQCNNCSQYSGKSTYWQYGSSSIYKGAGGGYWSSRASNRNTGKNWWTQTRTPELTGSGEFDSPCSEVTPCGRHVSFELPKDTK